MSKQTAVEWLEQAYWDNKGTLSQKHFEQAKQMEKEQIIEAHDVIIIQGVEDGVNFWEQITGEQYYNETYGDKI